MIESSGRYSVDRGQIAVEYDRLLANFENAQAISYGLNFASHLSSERIDLDVPIWKIKFVIRRSTTLILGDRK